MARKKNADADRGHAEHSKAAALQEGMAGTMPRHLKVTMMGAGSGFTTVVLNDILLIPGLKSIEIALVDTDRKRLTLITRVMKKIAELRGHDPSIITASTKRREVMAGSHYIINCIEVSGVECVRHDNDIPGEYGVHQCIGDTIGPGGLFKALRTIPVWLDMLRDAEELCPEALVLNYTNPMNMMCLAAGRVSSMRVVGLCHSVQGTSHQLAQRAGVPQSELEFECAGINHLAWFTTLRHKGKDLYPKLMAQARKELAERKVPGEAEEFWDLVRKDVMLHFGAFVTESSGHLSEYLPYYRKRPDLLKKYMVPRYGGESGFYADNWPNWRKASDDYRAGMLTGEKPLDQPRSWEYASYIVEAREKDAPYRIHGNVMNRHRGAGALISNLMHDGCVEVACFIDRNGVNPTPYGVLPRQMAALCEANMRMFDLGAQAAIEKSRELAIHALMLDPLTMAVCSPAEIKAMALELFAAEKKFLRGYK
ncbi:MAG: alpha-galactosidase [Candidatus Sumerlaeota bacterium]|nr:alpha-galactosidase [Candidatus Sumerlaeota bacterium]